jgi:dimethylhistidine N-methyltransferase
MLTELIRADVPSEFALEVEAGLTKPRQKELPSKFLYDAIGSALFEVICLLPEYGLTRAEERILQAHAADIVSQLRTPVIVTELGSGAGRKTRYLLEALSRRQATFYYPVEISATALAVCEQQLSDIESISIVGFEREYLDGLLEVAARRRDHERLLVLFLGSTIGNFDREAASLFLRRVRQVLLPGDYLLLGADLEKSPALLLAAYDDSLGVTGAFNLNLLARINRELDADFDLGRFAHLALFNERERRIEMHLRSRSEQRISIPALSRTFSLGKDETIWTESCHKYSPPELARMAMRAGFRCAAQWLDHEWPFAENLWIAE